MGAISHLRIRVNPGAPIHFPRMTRMVADISGKRWPRMVVFALRIRVNPRYQREGWVTEGFGGGNLFHGGLGSPWIIWIFTSESASIRVIRGKVWVNRPSEGGLTGKAVAMKMS